MILRKERLLWVLIWSVPLWAGIWTVPIYWQAGIGLGYDSNILKLSADEQDRVSWEAAILGDSDTFDSGVLRTRFGIDYAPVLFKDQETNLSLDVSWSHFTQSSTKNYASLTGKIEHHLGSYQWLKLSYSIIPEYYLRPYYDRDAITSERQVCSFGSEVVALYYSHPLWRRTWASVQLKQSRELYNSRFTEFDTKRFGAELRLSTRILQQRISLFFEMGDGDNITFNEGYNSTRYDRSYRFNKVGTSLRLAPRSWNDHLNVYYRIEHRKYESDIADDPLHSGREHLDHLLSTGLVHRINANLTAELSWKIRHRQTESELDWVEDLKTYTKHEIWLEFSYRFYSDWWY